MADEQPGEFDEARIVHEKNFVARAAAGGSDSFFKTGFTDSTKLDFAKVSAFVFQNFDSVNSVHSV